MEIGLNETDRDMRVQMIRRHDVQHCDLRDLIGMVERHPMRNAAAAIVSDDWK